jgi:hypothetical protein
MGSLDTRIHPETLKDRQFRDCVGIPNRAEDQLEHWRHRLRLSQRSAGTRRQGIGRGPGTASGRGRDGGDAAAAGSPAARVGVGLTATARETERDGAGALPHSAAPGSERSAVLSGQPAGGLRLADGGAVPGRKG